MDGRAKVTRVSSALDLDLTPVVEETARLVRSEVAGAVSQAVAEVVMPALAQVDQRVKLLAGLLQSAALGPDEMRATLACHLPSGIPMAVNVAAFQAERLAEAGYALVPISGPALEHAQATACVPVPCPPFEEMRLEISPEPPEPGAFARAAMGDEWTERTAAGYAAQRTAHETLVDRGLVPPSSQVDSLLHSGAPSDDLADWTSSLREGTPEQRADARLAEENAAGVYGAWHEPDQQ
jgi:hypothetical protein